MQAFVYEDEFDQIEFEGGLWVRIAKSMSYRNMKYLIKQFGMGNASTGKEEVSEVDIHEFNMALLLMNIKEWNLPDRYGDGCAPIDQEHIDSLNSKIATRLLEEIGNRNPF